MTKSEIYCIENYIEQSSATSRYSQFNFYKGNFYTMITEKRESYGKFSLFAVTIKDDNKVPLVFYINSRFHIDIFPKHFISLKQYRKLKLEKINENR